MMLRANWQVTEQRQAVLEAQWKFFVKGLESDQAKLAKCATVPSKVASKLHMKEVLQREGQIQKGHETVQKYQAPL